MSASRKAMRIGGLLLHILVGGMMIFAGAIKLFGAAPKELVEGMSKYGLEGKLQLIGAGELISAILLLIPYTSSLGLLLTSAFWGGVICIHMSHGEPYAFPSVLLALTWLGAYLRNPLTMSSFIREPSLYVEPREMKDAHRPVV